MSHELSWKKDPSTEGSDAISPISAIAYGFMGSQALFAALELGLFTTLSQAPCGLDALAVKLHARQDHSACCSPPAWRSSS